MKLVELEKKIIRFTKNEFERLVENGDYTSETIENIEKELNDLLCIKAISLVPFMYSDILDIASQNPISILEYFPRSGLSKPIDSIKSNIETHLFDIAFMQVDYLISEFKNEEENDFFVYVSDYYSPNEIFGHFFDNNLKNIEIKRAINAFINSEAEFVGDTLDREVVRDIMLMKRGITEVENKNFILNNGIDL